MRKVLKNAWIDTIPVLSGYIVLGIGFGILLSSKGFGIPWALGMSVFIFAGSMQYVAVDFLGNGAALLAVALTTLMVNCRHLFYGISMINKYKGTGKFKPYLIFALSDETYSLVCQEHPEIPAENRNQYFFLVSLLDQSYWIIGTIIGSVLGSVLTINTAGIDFSLTALFVTVYTEQWLTTKDHIPAIIGIVTTLICLIIFGSQSFLIPSMILITAALTVLKYLRKENNRNAS